MHVPRVIAGSIVVHALVVLGISGWLRSGKPARRSKPPSAATVELIDRAAEVEPLAVVFLGDQPAANGPIPTAAAGQVARSSSRNIGHAAATKGPATEPTAEPKEPGGLLAMRGRRHDLGLPGAVGDRIAAAGVAQPEQPTEPRWTHDPKIKLLPNGNGEYRVRDPVGTFRVAPDGTVGITHAPDITFKLNLPTLGGLERSGAYAKRRIAEWAADPYKRARVGPNQDLPRHLTAVPGSCDSAADTMCFTAEDQQEEWAMEDEALESLASGDVAQGRLDLTAYLAKKVGVGDVYASRKLKILDQTRDERVVIGTAYRTQQANRAAELVRRNLVALWSTTIDAGERRAALFAMWDECSEAEGTAGGAGAVARAMVIGWIRTHLPVDSPEAFTADEIATLDARRTSRAHFAPY